MLRDRYACSYGQYSLACTPCITGTVSTDGRQCLQCQPGQGPNTEQTGCVPCTGNTFSNPSLGTASCEKCPTGFAANADHISCEDIDECNIATACSPELGQKSSSVITCGCTVTEYIDCIMPGCENTDGSLKCAEGFKADSETHPTFCIIPSREPEEAGAEADPDPDTKQGMQATTLKLADVDPAALVKGSPAQKSLMAKLRAEMAKALNVSLADIVISDLKQAADAGRRRLQDGSTATFSVKLKDSQDMEQLKTQMSDPGSKLLSSAGTGLAPQKVDVTFGCPAGTRMLNGACQKCGGSKYTVIEEVLLPSGDETSSIVKCESCPDHQVANTQGDGCVCMAGYYDAWQGAGMWTASGTPIDLGAMTPVDAAAFDVQPPTRLEIYCWKQAAGDTAKESQGGPMPGSGRCVKCPEDCLSCNETTWRKEQKRVLARDANSRGPGEPPGPVALPIP